MKTKLPSYVNITLVLFFWTGLAFAARTLDGSINTYSGDINAVYGWMLGLSVMPICLAIHTLMTWLKPLLIKLWVKVIKP